jgi:two-component system phosphate regulon response regulator OmpR
MSRKVLLIDNDARHRQWLGEFLRSHGVEVDGVGSAAAAQRRLRQARYDALILDPQLPDQYGIGFCRTLREQDCHLPILLLSAKADDVDRIIGLEVGADDYLAKPCNPREVLARLLSVLRRLERPAAAHNSVCFGDFELDRWTRALRRGAEPVHLTSGEFALLEVFVCNSRRVLSRDQLLQLTAGREWDALTRSVDIHVSRLRRLIEDDPEQPRYLQTIWGRGYMFVPDPPQKQIETTPFRSSGANTAS